jgi:peroxiredoxin
MLKNVMLMVAGILYFATNSFAQKVNLTGNIKGLGDIHLIFYYTYNKVLKSDTVDVKDGKFNWIANLPQAQKVTIMFPKRAVGFYAESGNIEIKGNADSLGNFKITGSKMQNEFEAFNKSTQDLSQQELALNQKYGKVSKDEQLALEQKLSEIRSEKTERVNKYIAAHPKSDFSVSLIAGRAVMGEYSSIKASFDLLDPSAQHSQEGQMIAERLAILKRSAVGEQMLDFTQNNTEGQPVRFADFKGHYVLVDFWASWCGPCRAENPNVLKAYNRYKDRNFTVIGISLDDKAALWKKAIADDGMPWAELSDLKGWKNELSTYYGIHGIPSTLLIDPQGKIIAKYLRGEMLNKKLAELFN